MLRRISKVLLTLVLTFSVVTAFGFAPSQDAYALAKKPKVTSVTLNHKVITIKKGKTLKLKAKVLPKKAAKKAKLVWKTSKKKVATVKSGKVKAAKKKTGKVTITVSVKGTKKKAKCTVYVGTPVKNVNLAQNAITVDKGKTASAGASVSPAKATVKKITYTSDNEAVATVDKNGQITGVSEGTAVITATPVDEAGKAAKLTVTVVYPKEVTISKIEDLTPEVIEAIKAGKVEQLVIKSENEINIKLPNEDFSKAKLIIDAPKGHIENYTLFKSIDIKAISPTTLVEHAQGNTINYAAQSGTIRIAEEGVAEVSVVSGAGNLALVNDGAISALNVDTRASVDISGSADQTIQTNIAKGAADASISTSMCLNVNAEAPANLTLREGAEDTVVAINNDSSMPNISGLSRIEVTNKETGDSTFIVANNEGQSGVTTKKVTMAGDVTDVNGEPLSGAKVYAIPYTGKLNTAEVGKLVARAAGNGTTAANGSYSIANVTAGNYYVLVQKAGYADYSATTIITTSNADIFNVPAITLVEAANAAKTGTLSGSLIDSVNGNPVESGLTVMLREGGNNISGDVLQTTTTDGTGHYSFATAVKLGQYTVQVVDNRTSADKHYITTSFDAFVANEGANTVNNTLSYRLDSEQVRFVLTWGNRSSGASADIDSHLVGPKASEDGHFHTWYSDMNYQEMSGDQVTTYADLDRDDTEYEGPETTTIYMKSKGVYSFYVHDYSNRDATSGNTQLTKSAAVVKVYMGNTLKKTYYVPNKEGILWYVCDYDTTTNKLTEKGTMSYWPSEDLEAIGLSPADLAKNYQDKLADRIATAEKYLGEMKDGYELKTSGQTEVNSAKAVRNSTDLAVLREHVSKLGEWISSVESPLYFEVRGEGIDEYYNDDIDGVRVVRITGYANDLPEFTVTPENETTTCEVKASDKAGYKKMIVVKAESGVTRTCYVTYERSRFGAFISEVESKDTEAFYISNCRYDREDEETAAESIMEIYGTAETAPANMLDYLKITARDPNATVQLTKDAPGYDGKAVIKSGDITRTYYIRYQFDLDYALGLDYITTDEKLYEDDESEDPETLIAYSDIDWPEDDDVDYRIAYVYLNSLKEPSTLNLVPVYKNAKAELKASDNDAYKQMAVVSYNGHSKKYYITYRYTDHVMFGFKNIGDDNPAIIDWDTYNEWDDEVDEPEYILQLSGVEETLPADLKLTPYTEETKVSIVASDKTGYDKMAVVTFRDSTRKYYIDYRYNESDVEEGLTIDSVNVSNEEEGLIASGEGYRYSDDEGIYCIDLEGNVSEITPDMDFNVNRLNNSSSYEILPSDLEGYAAIIRVSYGSKSRDYYVRYTCLEPEEPVEYGKFDIQSVSLSVDDQVIAETYRTYSVSDDENNEFNVLEVMNYSYAGEVTDEDILQGFQASVYDGNTTVSVGPSDKDGYGCKLVLTAVNEDGSEESVTYYVTQAYYEE